MSEIALQPKTTVTPSAESPHFAYECLQSGAILHDQIRDGDSVFPLAAPGVDGAFLRTRYRTRQLTVGPEADGVYRFSEWLPVRRRLAGSGASVTYRSETLGAAVGLNHLYVTFSGWWPERGARIPTGTFKEHEAYAVYGRMGAAADHQSLVVASAGNTARAFLRVASENDLPLVVVVPEVNLPDLWTVGQRGSSTTVVAVGDGADYGDAIRVAGILAAEDGFVAEGGARNVARRDGMGTTFLSAATTIGRIPDHYFQAVGSGTGAIAAWEANRRLIADGRWGSNLARLHLAQNAPFQVLVDSWNARSRTLLLPEEDTARRHVERIAAKVLANRRPPWGPVGGLFDALTETDGTMYAVDNAQAAAAARLFEDCEGIDLSPAARVAVGALVQAVERGTIDRDEVVNLNITGGGYARARHDLQTRPLQADVVVPRRSDDGAALAATVRARRERVNQRPE